MSPEDVRKFGDAKPEGPNEFATILAEEARRLLVMDRYERRATVVTTNLAFAEWVTVFAGDEKLTTALLDRLAHHATVLTTKGKSYRMRKRRGREEPS